MKKIEPKLQKLSPKEESADLEATFNILKNKEIVEKKVALKTATPRGRPKKSAAAPAVSRDGKTRLTIDLPTEIYETVNKHKEDTGQNFTHLIVMLLKKHFKKAV